MFQCIIQQRNGWIHASSPDIRDGFPDIRIQLNEQLRCLDIRMETQVSLIQELQDFFRKRAEVEIDYSKSLEKLVKTLQTRHKDQKQKREEWPLFSSYSCWQHLVNETRALAKDHAVLSNVYSVHLVTRLQTIIEDIQRIYKRCREICYETHEEIFRVLQELQATVKTYHIYQAECKAAEAKLRIAESQRSKLQQSIPKDKLERSKKYRLTEKEVQKRRNKYMDARLKSLKAKNEYLLCLEASNTTIQKYFIEDIGDLIDCMDLGFCSTISRAILIHVTADQSRCKSTTQNAEILTHAIQTMDSRTDKQKFLEQHSAAFMIPKRIEFQGTQRENSIEPELQKLLHQEMEQRLILLGVRLDNLRLESEEIWKTLETAEINLLAHLNSKEFDATSSFGDEMPSQMKSDLASTKFKADRQEIEEFYLTKIREYILGTSKIARLDAKAELIRNVLDKETTASGSIILSNVPKRKRIGRINLRGQPKLFGGSLEEYLEASSEAVPLIMRSCIRVINLYGLHHQGIFRISGSQVEITNYRESFEKGEDPLADTNDASDINSVAGVLKLYLRELREPIFPIFYFEQFISLANLETRPKIVSGVKDFLKNLPRAVLIVLRYLFAFLNHLSEYADENMMDSYNLAICFGPTLMPAPEDKDQVQYQNQINDIIKNMIQFHEEIFPDDLDGIQYEKYLSDIDVDVEDSPIEQITEDLESEVYPSEDDKSVKLYW